MATEDKKKCSKYNVICYVHCIMYTYYISQVNTDNACECNPSLNWFVWFFLFLVVIVFEHVSYSWFVRGAFCCCCFCFCFCYIFFLLSPPLAFISLFSIHIIISIGWSKLIYFCFAVNVRFCIVCQAYYLSHCMNTMFIM